MFTLKFTVFFLGILFYLQFSQNNFSLHNEIFAYVCTKKVHSLTKLKLNVLPNNVKGLQSTKKQLKLMNMLRVNWDLIECYYYK